MYLNERKVFIIAELSANHCQDFEIAVKTIRAAKEAGADAIKLQTYTPDTITINCRNKYFRIEGTIWEGQTLYQLYKKAYTPWEWQPKLKKIAEDIGLVFFSTPFDFSAVDFLEGLNVTLYKVASFELVDIPLLRRIASTGKPVIMSTGMAILSEIDEAVGTLKENGAKEIALLKCTSAYPAPYEEMNLRTISHLADAFGLPVGISDHSPGIAVPVSSVALGAKIIEKHLILSRNLPSPDAAFSLEPDEFKAMAEAVRATEKALGKVSYELTEKQKESRVFRRSLFVVEDVQAGEEFTEQNIRSIRPGYGLHTRYLPLILGRSAKRDIKKGTPLNWELVR